MAKANDNVIIFVFDFKIQVDTIDKKFLILMLFLLQFCNRKLDQMSFDFLPVTFKTMIGRHVAIEMKGSMYRHACQFLMNTSLILMLKKMNPTNCRICNRTACPDSLHLLFECTGLVAERNRSLRPQEIDKPKTTFKVFLCVNA